MNPEMFAEGSGGAVHVVSIGLAAFGGLAVNLLNLIDLHKVPKGQRPNFNDWLYWLPFIVFPCLGGVLAFAYEASGTQLNAILAINVGVTAPLIIRGFAAGSILGKTSVDPGEGA